MNVFYRYANRWMATWSITFSVLYVTCLVQKLAHQGDGINYAVVEPALYCASLFTPVVFAVSGLFFGWFREAD